LADALHIAETIQKRLDDLEKGPAVPSPIQVLAHQMHVEFYRAVAGGLEMKHHPRK
jgi:hypothetical protein